MSVKRILVTGINGYIGSHIGLQLLHKGYIVRGASRSPAAKEQLLAEAFKGYEGQYEHYVVPDMAAAGAFDAAVQGVDGIIHVASPIDFRLTTADAFFGPAVGGVTSILASAARHAGSRLQSFVLTSSIAAVADRFKNPPDHVYDVEDWNTSAEPRARESFNTGMAYAASKAMAERAMWDWAEQNQPSFALSAVNPGLVYGPPVALPATPDQLNESLQVVWKLFSGQDKIVPPGIGSGTAIDVRDVAALHIWCVENPAQAAAGRRYIAVSGKIPPQGIADLLRKHYPDRDIVVGNPGEGYVTGSYAFPEGDAAFVTDNMHAALGKNKVIGLEESILDSVAAFEKRWPDAIKNKKL